MLILLEVSGLYSCVYKLSDSIVLEWSQWDKMFYLWLTRFEESSSFRSLFLFEMPISNFVLGLKECILSFLTSTQMILQLQRRPSGLPSGLSGSFV